MFVFRLETSNGVPPYLQMVQQVRHAVLLGYLQDGDRLPLIREAVEQLAINPNTVSKAYRQLEQEGLVTAKPGVGTFVAATRTTPVPPGRYATLRRGLERWLTAAHEAGLDEEAIDALIAVVRREQAGSGAA